MHTVSLTERLGKLPLGRFHWNLLFVICVGWAFDAMDTGIVSFVLPVLSAEWNLTPQQAGMIGSVGLLGMSLGALCGGMAADKWGRRKILVLTLLVYGLATGACGLAPDYRWLLFFRFIVGFGLGAELPVAITLMSEYAPTAHRGRLVVLLESSWAFGWVAAALVSFKLIPAFGWQIAFFIGALPALYAVFLRRGTPESAVFLLKKGKAAEAEAIVRKIEASLGVSAGNTRLKEEEEEKQESGISLLELFRRKYLRRTVCLWLLWFGIVFSYYGIFLWLPSILVGAGHTVAKSFEFTLWITVAQIPGYFAAAALVDRLGRKPTMVLFVLGTAACAHMFGSAGTSADIYLWGCLMSFFNLGAWGVLYTYSPELYPARFRSTAAGAAAAFGRIGGIIAPLVVGNMMSVSDKAAVFAMFAAVLVAVAAAMAFLGVETKGRELED